MASSSTKGDAAVSDSEKIDMSWFDTFNKNKLTSLYLGNTRVEFPNHLDLPTVTYLGLSYICFRGGNDGRVDPFSTFTSLTTLYLAGFKTHNKETLYISSSSLLNLTVACFGDYFRRRELCGQTQQSDSHIELLAPSLCNCHIICNPRLTLSGTHLSSIKHVWLNMLMSSNYSAESRLGLLNFLIGMTNLESLGVHPSTLQALSVIPDVLNFHTSWRDLKSLKLNMTSEAFDLTPLTLDETFERIANEREIINEVAGGKSWKENAKLRELVQVALAFGGKYSFTLESMIQFLVQNSPTAEIGLILRPQELDSLWRDIINIPPYA